MAKSSINIKMSTLIAFIHNAREAIVSYLIDISDRNECDRGSREAYEYYIGLLKEATANYTAKIKQKIQTNPDKFIWEAEVNLNFDHGLKDLQNLAKFLEEKYGWQVLQCAVHRDEGHIDQKSGKKVYNFHGHIVFFMLNKDGLYAFKKRDFGIKKMQELQTLVAEKLGMERGVPKSISKIVRLEHNQYRQVAQSQEKEKNKFNRLQSMYDLLSNKLTLVSANKKKTAHKIRKLIQKNKQNNTLNKIKQFCVKSIDTVFNDLSRYPLLNSLNFMEDSFIFQWLEAAKAEILSLRAENEMMKDMLDNSMKEESDIVSKAYDKHVDTVIKNEVFNTSSSSKKESIEVQEDNNDEDIEMAAFYFDEEPMDMYDDYVNVEEEPMDEELIRFASMDDMHEVSIMKLEEETHENKDGSDGDNEEVEDEYNEMAAFYSDEEHIDIFDDYLSIEEEPMDEELIRIASMDDMHEASIMKLEEETHENKDGSDGNDTSIIKVEDNNDGDIEAQYNEMTDFYSDEEPMDDMHEASIMKLEEKTHENKDGIGGDYTSIIEVENNLNVNVNFISSVDFERRLDKEIEDFDRLDKDNNTLIDLLDEEEVLAKYNISKQKTKRLKKKNIKIKL